MIRSTKDYMIIVFSIVNGLQTNNFGTFSIPKVRTKSINYLKGSISNIQAKQKAENISFQKIYGSKITLES